MAQHTEPDEGIVRTLQTLPKGARLLLIRGDDCKILRHADDVTSSIDYFPDDGKPPRGALRPGAEDVFVISAGIGRGDITAVSLEPGLPTRIAVRPA